MKKMSTTYGGQTAYTLKDISENSGIPVSRLRRHIQEGKLDYYEKSGTYGYIILQSQVIPYLAKYAKEAEQRNWEQLEREEQVVEPMESLKVLSIDWDFFIAATNEERGYMFPDGGNEGLAPYVQNVVWASHYGNPSYDLKKVGVDREALKKIRFVLSNQRQVKAHNCVAAMMVTDSHKYAYDFITDSLLSPQQPIEVYNVDFHHDIYDIPGSIDVSSIDLPHDTYDVKPGKDEVDCGNWLRILSRDYHVSPHWIAREDSDAEGETQEALPRATLDDLMNIQFDIVFICRSGMWSPPHLDIEFIRLVNAYVHKWKAKCEKGILQTRYNAEFKAMVEQHRQQMSKVIKTLGGEGVSA